MREAQRIVSFLPSATEMVCALGLADRLVGVTHECDYPAEVQGKPVVVRSALPVERLTLAEIDAAVSERMRRGESLYLVDERLMRELAPDLIVTQDLCQVCAPSGNEITQVLRVLSPPPEILWTAPNSIAGIEENIRALGHATNTSGRAEELIAAGRARLNKIAAQLRNDVYRPRVFCMEWIDPVYCSGHWVPEMVEIAGGTDALSVKGGDSVRVPWSDVLQWAPEVMIISPCGFNLRSVIERADRLSGFSGWERLPAVAAGRVFAVDANSYFARPGPRVIDGTELLAHLLHPQLFPWTGPADAFQSL
jgi:iron complex transport system substrate-binding protein